LTQEIILQIQRELFIVGAELATSKENRGKLESGKTLVEDSMIKNLEAKIDILEEKKWNS
jgi:cob(I)alamin adenosyltransferase